MVARAGRDYDVLLVGYVSRFTRNLLTAVNARQDLHAAGAAILFCDERVLSSDEDEWEAWARETVEAEAYSRRLGKRIREGYAAKFRRLADPGGHPPLGFTRAEEPPQTLVVGPDTIGTWSISTAVCLGDVLDRGLGPRGRDERPVAQRHPKEPAVQRLGSAQGGATRPPPGATRRRSTTRCGIESTT